MTDLRIITERDRDIEFTLARFLTEPEAAEATWLEKPAMEPECLRSLISHCEECGDLGPVWRYQLDSTHRRYLLCPHEDEHKFNDYTCESCFNGATDWLKEADLSQPQLLGVMCAYGSDELFDEFCQQVTWITAGGLPWLCSRCWRHHIDAETAHIKHLQEIEA